MKASTPKYTAIHEAERDRMEGYKREESGVPRVQHSVGVRDIPQSRPAKTAELNHLKQFLPDCVNLSEPTAPTSSLCKRLSAQCFADSSHTRTGRTGLGRSCIPR